MGRKEVGAASAPPPRMAWVLGRRLLRGLGGGGLPAAAAGGLLLLPGPAARAEEAEEAGPGCGCGGDAGEAAGGEPEGERPGAERHSAKWRVFTDMARDRAREGNHAEAERQFTKDTAGLRRRLRVAGQLPDSTVTEKDRLLKEVLSGEMRDRQVKLLGSRLALIERIERLDYPERDEELTLLRRDPPENKVRWLGLRTTSREKKAGESLRR